MALERQVIFWLGALLMLVALLWLLSPVLLPFVAGMVLAYLLDPLARLGERFGVGRGISALIVLSVVLIELVVAVMAAAPLIAARALVFLESLPGPVSKLQWILSDPSRPWLAKIFGGKLSDPSKSLSG